ARAARRPGAGGTTARRGRHDGPARAARRPGAGGTTALPGLRDPVLDRTVVGAAVPAWPPCGSMCSHTLPSLI
ncbi:hypothetical protein, partial [Streptomyces typhae]|uniref:hypothetical protein n=1 Tax=Streptomyces typhae TaxID=2681492 RepID=UPI0012F67B17